VFWPSRFGVFIRPRLSGKQVYRLMSRRTFSRVRACRILVSTTDTDLIAVPVVMLFLVPFVLALRYGISFWVAYTLACVWLFPGYFVHRALVRLMS
jgi:hypothetical protein